MRFSFILLLLLFNNVSQASQDLPMRYTKIVGTYLKYSTGERIDTGVAYASQDFHLDKREIVVQTITATMRIETRFQLQGPNLLDFVAVTADPKIPNMIGHFFNIEYDECTVSAFLPDQRVNVNGVVTKLDKTHALSTKTVTNSVNGEILGILQERVELISEASFEAAVAHK